MDEIDFMFQLQYKIYGLEVQNRFYIPAIQTMFSWLGLIYRHDNSLVSTFSLNRLAGIIGLSRNALTDRLNKILRGEIKNTQLSFIIKSNR